MSSPSRRVWYASYGSNLLEKRFLLYLRGGRFSREHASHPGARDQALPLKSSILLKANYALLFSKWSERWGGGVAFIKPNLQMPSCWIRCWDVTEEQFFDIAAQENQLTPGHINLDVPKLIKEQRLDLGSGWYNEVIYLGELNNQPILTFTTSNVDGYMKPSTAYLSVLIAGLKEGSSLSDTEIQKYLAEVAGIQAEWTKQELYKVISETVAP